MLASGACSSGDEANPLAGLSDPGGDPATYVAFFDGLPDLSEPTATTDWTERGRATVDALQARASSSQADALALADEAGVDATTWWIANAMSVDGSVELGTALSTLPGVTSVVELVEGTPVELDPPWAAPDAQLAPWHVDLTGATTAWETGVTGEGIVVATIDTGVDATHPSLAGSMRAERAWWDALGTCIDQPCDDVGHGTATTGLLVGGGTTTDGRPESAIGVAPDATWISARACSTSGCDLTDLWSAGQFLLAPTDASGADPDPAARPHVVSMSFALPAGTEGLDALHQAFDAAGMLAFFAAGDAGPACTSVGSPADHGDAFAVGATDLSGVVDQHSSRGPSHDGKPTPDIDALLDAVRG